MDDRPQLGPFRLERPLGKGGMARVVRATHIRHNQPVAIKVMIGERARKQRFVESFHREVRAVARMNHPNIIRVFDYGAVDESVAAATDSWLSARSPYMVMELADSTLSNLDHSQLNWPHAHTILAYILEALAHAHARELVHRDLKPDNVLFVAAEAGARLKLSDFGIAYRMHEKRQLLAEDEIITGTPKYMAPEQIRGRIREQGPWTDLYAVGCLAYWLVAGAAPFTGESIEQILRFHLTAERPSLQPNFDVPAGFESWVHGLLRRRPRERFRRAADAIAALADVAGPPPHRVDAIATRATDEPSAKMTLFDDSGTTRVVDHLPADDSPGADSADPGDTDTVAKLPPNWREDRPAAESPQMAGVGRNLFELRELPLVGRQPLRDELWQRLLDTAHTHHPHAAILEGPGGVGKTRLADWLSQRADEVGAARVLRATHSPTDTPGDALARMVADHLRCTGLGRDEILQRVCNFYDPQDPAAARDRHECIALAELIAGGVDPEFGEADRTVRFAGPEQRWVVFRRFLDKLAARRPIVTVFDDVHWGSESLQFVEYLLDRPDNADLPVLAVLTTRRRDRHNPPKTAELFDRLADSPWTDAFAVGPLEESAHRRLVEHLLKLQPELAEQVAQRTRGNPLFANQVVGDWIQRDLLVVGEEGFELADDTAADLPEGVRSLLVHRIERHTGQSVHDPAGERLTALELGAVLGGQVDAREWRVVCEIAGIDPPGGLLEQLAAHSLIRRTEQGWRFRHGALRETLLDVAGDNGRLVDHHRRCVEMLRRLYDTCRRRLAPRLADHLLGAETWKEALEPLRRAMDHFCQVSDYRIGLKYFRDYERARRQPGVNDDDPRTVRGWLHAAELHRSLGDIEASAQRLEASQKLAEANQWNDLLGLVHVQQAKIAFYQGRFEQAVDFGQRALQLRPLREDPDRAVRALIGGLGWTYFRQSKYRKALQIAQRAKDHLELFEDDISAALVLNFVATVHNRLENYERASDAYQQALSRFEAAGDLTGVGTVHNNLGELHRTVGRHRRAGDHYRRASEIFRRVGAAREYLSECNLGVLHLTEGDIRTGTEHFEAALKALERTENAPIATACHAGLAACTAHRGDFSAHDEHLRSARTILDDSPCHDPDIGFVFQHAGEQLQQAGEHRRAQRAYRLALYQWRELGETERADELRWRLEGM